MTRSASVRESDRYGAASREPPPSIERPRPGGYRFLPADPPISSAESASPSGVRPAAGASGGLRDRRSCRAGALRARLGGFGPRPRRWSCVAHRGASPGIGAAGLTLASTSCSRSDWSSARARRPRSGRPRDRRVRRPVAVPRLPREPAITVVPGAGGGRRAVGRGARARRPGRSPAQRRDHGARVRRARPARGRRLGRAVVGGHRGPAPADHPDPRRWRMGSGVRAAGDRGRGVLAALLVGFLGTTPESPLPPTGTTEGLLLNLLTAAVLAPIGEEVFYRGFALTAWLRRWSCDRRSSGAPCSSRSCTS